MSARLACAMALTGEAMAQALNDAYAAPPALVKRAAELSGGAGR